MTWHHFKSSSSARSTIHTVVFPFQIPSGLDPFYDVKFFDARHLRGAENSPPEIIPQNSVGCSLESTKINNFIVIPCALINSLDSVVLHEIHGYRGIPCNPQNWVNSMTSCESRNLRLKKKAPKLSWRRGEMSFLMTILPNKCCVRVGNKGATITDEDHPPIRW